MTAVSVLAFSREKVRYVEAGANTGDKKPNDVIDIDAEGRVGRGPGKLTQMFPRELIFLRAELGHFLPRF